MDGVGIPGRNGHDGLNGKDGLDGTNGQPGRDGVDGKDGAPGKDGRDGVDGKDGQPGRDGVDAVGAQGVTAFTPMVQVFRDGIPYHMAPRGSRFLSLPRPARVSVGEGVTVATIAQLGPFVLAEAIDSLNPVPVEAIGTVNVNIVSGGSAAPYSYLAAGSANQDSRVVKAGAGSVYSITGVSAIADLRYLKLYNKATAPTSADTPVLRLPIPANSFFSFPVLLGMLFSAGISFRIATGLRITTPGQLRRTIARSILRLRKGHDEHSRKRSDSALPRPGCLRSAGSRCGAASVPHCAYFLGASWRTG